MHNLLTTEHIIFCPTFSWNTNYLFGSDRSSRSANLFSIVCSYDSKLSKAFNLLLSGSNLQAVLSALSQLSLSSVSTLLQNRSLKYCILFLIIICFSHRLNISVPDSKRAGQCEGSGGLELVWRGLQEAGGQGQVQEAFLQDNPEGPRLDHSEWLRCVPEHWTQWPALYR